MDEAHCETDRRCTGLPVAEGERNWDDPQLNNFRQNSPGDGAGAGLMPDLTIRGGAFTCSSTATAELDIDVCNRGTEPVADGVNVAAYLPGGVLYCVAQTGSVLRAGNCMTVTCDTGTGVPTDEAVAIKVVVDDDGMDSGAHTECRELNNAYLIEGVVCP